MCRHIAAKYLHTPHTHLEGTVRLTLKNLQCGCGCSFKHTKVGHVPPAHMSINKSSLALYTHMKTLPNSDQQLKNLGRLGRAATWAEGNADDPAMQQSHTHILYTHAMHNGSIAKVHASMWHTLSSNKKHTVQLTSPAPPRPPIKRSMHQHALAPCATFC